MLDKQAVQARIRRPMEIAQWVSLVAAVATMLVLGALNWSGMKGMLEPAGAAPLLAAGGAVILAAVALRFVLAE